MGNNFSSKYELFRNVKADDKKGLNKNYGIFLVLRRKTGKGQQDFDLCQFDKMFVNSKQFKKIIEFYKFQKFC